MATLILSNWSELSLVVKQSQKSFESLIWMSISQNHTWERTYLKHSIGTATSCVSSHVNELGRARMYGALRSNDYSAHVKVNSVKVRPSAERWAASSSMNDLFHLKSLTYGKPHSEFPPGPSLRTTSISCSCLHQQIYECFTVDVRLPSMKR